jgi:hypothetical protein
MKYLFILAVLAGSYYQFYLPKLNEESIRDFVAEIELADMNKDYNAIREQFTEVVLVSKLDKNLEVLTQLKMKKAKLIKAIKLLKSPKLNSIEKSEIENIEIFDDKAKVTSLNTHWVTVEGQRIKRVSREVTTIIIQQASFKVSEIGAYVIKARYVSSNN